MDREFLMMGSAGRHVCRKVCQRCNTECHHHMSRCRRTSSIHATCGRTVTLSISSSRAHLEMKFEAASHLHNVQDKQHFTSSIPHATSSPIFKCTSCIRTVQHTTAELPPTFCLAIYLSDSEKVQQRQHPMSHHHVKLENACEQW